ncbi:MAG: hypothetical protein A3G34_10600 [Candidatus Lindowbacteria bacterium RIFCSPLOWO2_12_FULL_62_27]|nr:MAG: hypothetical protein A3G34_10600 [Candidatus Lindowbacteria bacterium RIFCSPLOWO2_12_FULL_62_27]
MTFFVHHLALFASRGAVPPDSGAYLFGKRAKGRHAEIWNQVAAKLSAGQKLSFVLREMKNVFPDSMVRLVESGERAGQLRESLKQYAGFLRFQTKLRELVSIALGYPTLLFICTMVAVGFLLSYVTQRFIDMFKALGVTLPLPTRIVLAVSEFMSRHGMQLVVIGFALFLLYRLLRKITSIRIWLDALSLHWPVFGNLQDKMAMLNLAETTAMGLKSGIALHESFDLAAVSTTNMFLANGFVRIADDIRSGLSLREILHNRPGILSREISMLLISAERHGQFDKALNSYIVQQRDVTSDYVKTMTTLIEPIMVLIFGGAIGMIVMALFFPMFNMINIVK